MLDANEVMLRFEFGSIKLKQDRKDINKLDAQAPSTDSAIARSLLK